ncbi:2-succinyl-5-enolpyruvyl-6-hydroxy-3-cyclohexene-1-carboxylic-acid synthase [Sansalvadorimonas verongulae]|uniref:2-succinyl-5-enolpyruvyl-6-hydroxy-3- cyclohexene-1-carboxylic-acid synthase n=1 Tax=Sansalvadorimonas verongulae TaxID=2172824 RepID=UPI0012BB9775|nr:2-succinyl-5-enolpyruvyl-6-hydroxy-3-cyclohexene-1-carboxylic-acid synthase [Sansalvadorimonas verongulae]MTI12811.1 2-succinyl-5-enolpyruvyl-6-hydroxy-3-cyclohexene-1-carboxylic-acid synthase [Sansalvadorimonas verongulae]
MSQELDFTSLWCDLLFEELYRSGLREVCLAPGSRSAPLTLAADRHKGLTCHCHFDERGLGFFALGLARAKQEPVVVLTTSGTAVANLSPAIHEAQESGVPLIILTADRPPELLGCGANQTMNQYSVFGSAPVRSVYLPSPEPSLPARWLLSTISEAAAVLKSPEGGAVHINQQLREPLYGNGAAHDQKAWLAPVQSWLEGNQPICEWSSFPAVIPEQNLPQHQKVVVIAGVLSPQEAEAVQQLAQRAHCLLIADIQSGLHGAENALNCADLLLDNSDIQDQLHQATLVLQFGRRFVGKRIGQWLKKYNGEHWYIDPRQDRQDAFASVTRRITASIESFCPSLQFPNLDAAWAETLRNSSRKLADVVATAIQREGELTESWAVAQIKSAMNSEHLFVGNSMPIRLFDSLSTGVSPKHVVANRGISGIDGLVSSAAGHSQGSQEKTVLVIGDLSLLHDLNALALAARHRLLVVVLNNSGGSIFNIFPVANSETHTRFFQVEHDLQFAGAANMFGLNYCAPASREDFASDFREALTSDHGALIEVVTPPDEATNQFARLKQNARNTQWL